MLINRRSQRPKQTGQSATEFLLIAPLLFFIFFAIIQLAYIAYASLAVQRATLSIAKDAARSNGILPYDPEFQLLYSLAPLGSLNNQTLATVMATQCIIDRNQESVHVEVKYPMPIWVPMLGNLIGQPLPPSHSTNLPAFEMLKTIFKLLGKTSPNLLLSNSTPPFVHWVTFSADAIDENFI
jgi:hypothetical protein